MKTIKITLCPPCPDCPPSSECPEVEISDNQVVIGEPGNIAKLTHRQWNELVERIRGGDLPALPLSDYGSSAQPFGERSR